MGFRGWHVLLSLPDNVDWLGIVTLIVLAGTLIVLWQTLEQIAAYTKHTAELTEIERQRRDQETRQSIVKYDVDLVIERYKDDGLDLTLVLDNVGGRAYDIEVFSGHANLEILDWSRKDVWLPTLGHIYFRSLPVEEKRTRPLQHFSFTMTYKNQFDQERTTIFNVLIRRDPDDPMKRIRTLESVDGRKPDHFNSIRHAIPNDLELIEPSNTI